VADRTPKVFDKVWLYGERMTILAVRESGRYSTAPANGYFYPDGNLIVVTHDDADCRIERRVDSLEWVESLNAWRPIADRPTDVTSWQLNHDYSVSVPLSYMEEE
jgi:hypothetical protein